MNEIIKNKRKAKGAVIALMVALMLVACDGSANEAVPTGKSSVTAENDRVNDVSSGAGTEKEDASPEKNKAGETSDNNEEGSGAADTKEDSKMDQKETKKIETKPLLKKVGNKNPLITQRFGADPYALVYDGRVYIYMTGDEFMYDAEGKIIENNYSNIWTIRVISSDDLVNWTDHGEVYAASSKGAAKWGGNSWAPAAAWKMIDGKPKFFLYFANSGNGIAVLSSDTPYGPFTDPIGKALISRATPTCASVAWLFDPAVLMDDDGNAYIYFGGGIPSPDKIANPGTARMAKLADDMISLDGDPVAIENVEYLFEDSGINKINGKYYYSYCSNFNVPGGHKFDNGEIITMVSDKPLGPFIYNCGVLKNPGAFFGQGGNNHHCMFEFNGKMYIAYHARLLEDAMGNISSGYRSTNIDYVNFDENGNFKPSKGTREGVEQVKSFDPYATVRAVTCGNQSRNGFIPADESAKTYGSGDMLLSTVTGSWTCIYGADFGADGAKSFSAKLQGAEEGTVHVRADYLNGTEIAALDFKAGNAFETVTAELGEKLTGTHDIYFVFEGKADIDTWSFEK